MTFDSFCNLFPPKRLPLYRQHSLTTYLEEIARRQPVPGGGSALAAASALAASLALKVARFSSAGGLSRSRARKVDRAIIRPLTRLRQRMLRLVDEDASAYLHYRWARRAWRAHEGARERRRLERAVARSFKAPFDLAHSLAESHRLSRRLRAISKGSIVVDLDAADALTRAAFRSSMHMAALNAALLPSPRGRQVLLRRLKSLNGALKP